MSTTTFVAIAFFATVTFVLSSLSDLLDRRGLPSLLLAMVLGVLAGPYALAAIDSSTLGLDRPEVLLEIMRLTLAVTLLGVALRLPRGYWRANWRWLVASILVGMPLMFAIGSGLLLTLGLPLLTAMLIGGAITPTDPVVTTPIVTGRLSEQRIPERVRLNLSAESGLNDGLGTLLVALPVLLMTQASDEAWAAWSTRVLLWEICAPVVGGALAGYAAGIFLDRAVRARWTSGPSYLGYGLAFSFTVLAILVLLRTDAVLGVFVAGAVFADRLEDDLRRRLGALLDEVSRVVIVPVFAIIGTVLPLSRWADLGIVFALVTVAALIVPRMATVWLTRPLFAPLHSRAETAFLSWFAPVGVSALFYACHAEIETGDSVVLPAVMMAVALSATIHGLAVAPASGWIQRRTEGRAHPPRRA